VSKLPQFSIRGVYGHGESPGSAIADYSGLDMSSMRMDTGHFQVTDKSSINQSVKTS